MCGIAGCLETSGQESPARLEEIVRDMTGTLLHRGPDDGGVWVYAAAGIGLGNRRLAILDLSPAGRQPMRDSSGRYVIAFNGEVYNFRSLRAELEASGHRFRGGSDTEVLLEAIRYWGLRKALAKSNGMFAFALWDREEWTLHLVRDRLGEKPMYYGWVGGTFLFGSELKALRAHPGFNAEIDRNALALYLRHKYVPTPWSIYEGIFKLPPGTLISLKSGSPGVLPEPLTYWSIREAAERGAADPFRGTDEEAVSYLDGLLREAVRLRLESDVPLGAFLSGGVDSSTIVSLMQEVATGSVKTFTIGLPEAGYNEAPSAKAVASHLGTDHTELYVTPGDAMEVIPLLPSLYDEPFADSSQIPTFLVSQLARRTVTVSLSGDGGDELFGGYPHYLWVPTLSRAMRLMPAPLKRAIARSLAMVRPGTVDALFDRVDPVLPRRLRQRIPGDKLQKFTRNLQAKSPEALYYGVLSHWDEPGSVVVDGIEPPTTLTDQTRWARLPGVTEQMMCLDALTYLPDDILTKVDRASMGVSLEARVPLLDHRVVEFAWRLPLSMKIRAGQGKWLLRQLLYHYVPRELIDRPKAGFGIPIDAWLRGPLRFWAQALLDPRRLRQEGFLNPEPIHRRWQEHLSGQRNWQYLLWDVLVFQSWLETERATFRSSPARSGSRGG